MSDDEEKKTKQKKSVVTANTKTKDAEYRKTQQTSSARKDEQVKRKEKDKEKDRKKDRKQDKKK